MSENLAGRTAIVTGGSAGIGKGIAKVLLSKGAQVVITGRSAEKGAACIHECSDWSDRVAFVAADVSKAADCEKMVSETVARFGGVDILCANAGIFPEVPIATMGEDDIDAVLGTNLKGCILSVRAALGELSRSGRGRVVVTSSITGPITGYPGWSHYGASKAGQLGFVRTAAVELAPMGITVNAVLPGNVITEGLLELGEDYISGMAQTVPLKRLGTVDEVGFAVAFLASEEAGFITGQGLVVDGGQVLPESLV
ncbi:3-oxoacyl-ACP reductase FabG [Ferrimicrobium sp.]|uniref:3-oxoacyl-ACP reductase FabG n=1 Tax=Ferrimicrobium sp. TaxID=2926050 RepID=UPI00262F7C66|nr:3-oxoacyl-ACP reductase FabG [Ferrimicrobium sp.]